MPTGFVLAANDRLTPEEDAIDDPDDTADEVDDTLPADLWFVVGRTSWPHSTTSVKLWPLA